MDLILIRHAQTHSNVARALDTALPGADLTELGEQQIAALAASLAAERIDAVWTSPALRARRTALAVAEPRGLEPIVREGLVEIGAGDYEMSSDAAHGEEYQRMVVGWVLADLHLHLPGAEDGHTALARFDAVVAEVVASRLQSVAIVAHGGILRSWCGARVANVPAELVRDHPLPNTGVVRLTGTAGEWRATHWDDVVLGGDV